MQCCRCCTKPCTGTDSGGHTVTQGGGRRGRKRAQGTSTGAPSIPHLATNNNVDVACHPCHDSSACINHTPHQVGRTQCRPACLNAVFMTTPGGQRRPATTADNKTHTRPRPMPKPAAAAARQCCCVEAGAATHHSARQQALGRGAINATHHCQTHNAQSTTTKNLQDSLASHPHTRTWHTAVPCLAVMQLNGRCEMLSELIGV